MTPLLEPKPFEITRADGTVLKGHLHKFPAIAGRAIITQYPVANLPKLGDYAVSEELALRVLSYVTVDVGTENALPLTTRAIVDAQCVDWETFMKLEGMQIAYNCSFFSNGGLSDFWGTLREKARPLISQILTDLSAQSSQADAPRSTN